LIRHADSEVVAGVPAADWHLSEIGSERAIALLEWMHSKK